jgi:hypothetical protein
VKERSNEDRVTQRLVRANEETPSRCQKKRDGGEISLSKPFSGPTGRDEDGNSMFLRKVCITVKSTWLLNL